MNASVPRAPANLLVPPTTRALPENETLPPAPSVPHAWASCTASRREPRAPRKVARPRKAPQDELVISPIADPLSVLLPISRPRPDNAAPPAAFSPLT